MSFRCAVFMDPIEQIKPYKDSTFAMLLEAQRRNYELIYLTRDAVALQGVDLYVRARAIVRSLALAVSWTASATSPASRAALVVRATSSNVCNSR